MKTQSQILKTFWHTTFAFATMLLLVAFALTPVTAQPAYPDEAYDLEAITVLEDSLADPMVRAEVSSEQWHTFGDRLVEALVSSNEGIRGAAVRMIIQYGVHFEIDREGVFDLVRIYRDDPNDRMRRMAVVALGTVQDPWGMDMLKRSAKFEKVAHVRHTILAVLSEYGTVEVGPLKVVQ